MLRFIHKIKFTHPTESYQLVSGSRTNPKPMIVDGQSLRDELLAKSCETFRFNNKSVGIAVEYILFENEACTILANTRSSLAWVESTEGSFVFDMQIKIKGFWVNSAFEHDENLYLLVGSAAHESYFFVYRMGTFEFMHSFIIPRLNDAKLPNNPVWGLEECADRMIPAPLYTHVDSDGTLFVGHLCDQLFRKLQPNPVSGFLEVVHADIPTVTKMQRASRLARRWISHPRGVGVMCKGRLESTFPVTYNGEMQLQANPWNSEVYIFNRRLMIVAEYIPPTWKPIDHAMFPGASERIDKNPNDNWVLYERRQERH